MLGTEPEVIAAYVNTGQVKIVFWPVLNHGDPSVYATLTAECVGQQDPAKFWEIHEWLFTNQRDLWRAERDYFTSAAVASGADEAAFAACYDDPDALAQVLSLDGIRRDRGIAGQPYFDIGGTIYGGALPFESMATVIDEALAQVP